ncbi:MAG: signal peptidase II, partial [Chloroflexi bacterium]|nr:signal peptidase II [Chloroflexota bacterium]
GKVTDFISVGTFPVFNIADSAISIGVVVLLLGVWIKERNEKKAAATSDQLSVNSDSSTSLSASQLSANSDASASLGASQLSVSGDSASGTVDKK